MLLSLIWLVTVTSKKTWHIIALYPKGFTGKDIAARKISPQSTTYLIIKIFKESGSNAVKKISGYITKSSKYQENLLKQKQLQGTVESRCKCISTKSLNTKAFGGWLGLKMHEVKGLVCK